MRHAITRLVAGALLLSLGCLIREVHPGQGLLRRRCGACHTVPDRPALRRAGLERVLSEHRKRLQTTEAERQQLRDYLQAQ